MANLLNDATFSDFMMRKIDRTLQRSVSEQLEIIIKKELNARMKDIPKNRSIVIKVQGDSNIIIHTKSKRNAHWVYNELIRPKGILVSKIEWRSTKYGYVYWTRI